MDMSGWSLDDLDTTLPPGSVLAAGACAVVVADDPTYLAASGGGELVFVELGRPLDPSGGTVELRRPDGTTAGWSTYCAVSGGTDEPPCSDK